MRIAFFTDTFLPQVNGVATSIANFATELGRRGHRVLIVTPKLKEEGPDFEAKNVKVVYLPSVPALVYPKFRISPFVGLPRTLQAVRAFDPDIIHFHTTLMIEVDAVLMAKYLHKPLVGTNHIYLTKSDDSYLTFVAKHQATRWLMTRVVLAHHLGFLNACDLRIAPSQMLIDGLRKDGYKKTMEYLPNAVPAFAKKRPDTGERKRWRKKYELQEKVVLHVGRLSVEKKIEDVLIAFSHVHSKRKDVSLLIVGDGPQRGGLEVLAQKLGIERDTVFTGFVPPAQLMESGLPGIADVFVTASPMESQGMVLIEAMAFGIPIVAVGEGAVPEVVGDSGFLVKKDDVAAMANRIEQILADPVLAKKMSALSLERHSFFSIGTTTDRLLALYQKAIQLYQARTGRKQRSATKIRSTKGKSR